MERPERAAVIGERPNRSLDLLVTGAFPLFATLSALDSHVKSYEVTSSVELGVPALP